MAVAESNGSEPFEAEALRDRLEAASLNTSEPVRHHDGRVRAMPVGLVYPRFQVFPRRRRNTHGGAENWGVVIHSRAATTLHDPQFLGIAGPRSQTPISERCRRAQSSSLIGGRPSSVATVSVVTAL